MILLNVFQIIYVLIENHHNTILDIRNIYNLFLILSLYFELFTMKIKPYLKNFFLLALSFILVTVVAEIVLRVLGENPQRFIKDDSDFIKYDSVVQYTYQSNLNLLIENENYSIQIFTNSNGYRDDEWQLNSDEQRILIIGDSFSVGYGINKSERYSDVLSSKLSDFKIYNAAVSGYNIEQMKLTAIKLLNVLQPNFIILGLNIDVLNRVVDPYVYFEGFCLKKSKLEYAEVVENKLILYHFSNRYIQYIERFLLTNSFLYNFVIDRSRILKKNLINGISGKEDFDQKLLDIIQQQLSELSVYLQENEIKLLVLPVIQHNRASEFELTSLYYYERVKSFCLNNKITFVDVVPQLEFAIKKGSDLWINNDPHWNKDAHEITAEVIVETLMENRK